MPRPQAPVPHQELVARELHGETVVDPYAWMRDRENGEVLEHLTAENAYVEATLEHLADHKRRRIALETKEIYAPLAHRLGMAAIRWELEDLAFKHLESEAYRKLVKKIDTTRREREELIHLCRHLP